jgi:prepilin-type N-terminal cleavage/methylation domain-containing protein/prepilin-type processing-associated H-X9-DG protein
MNSFTYKNQALGLRKQGFTLIELLVVIAIIAILASILFPVFARARENARRASCSSNLKQLALGMNMYAQDYDEKFPKIDGPLGGDSLPIRTTPVAEAGGLNYFSTNGKYWDGWVAGIYPYVKSSQIFLCPSNTFNAYGVNYGLPSWAFDSNNAIVSYLGESQPLARFAKPSESMLITEKSNGGGDQYLLSAEYYACARPHFDGGNIAFVDGHVKWMRFLDTPIGGGWPAPNSAAYAIHPPVSTFSGVF